MAQRKKSEGKKSDKKAAKKKAAKKAAKKGAGAPAPLRKSGRPVVGILTGSPSDLPVVMKARDVLEQLDIPSDIRVLSAHRTPVATVQYVTAAREAGIEVLIACAGMAAHLAGVVAAHPTPPVIGVPLAPGAPAGLDALLPPVQMPPGIPVATVGVDGSRNAAFLAARILTLKHPELIPRLEAQLELNKTRYDSPNLDIPGQALAGPKKKR